MNDRAEFIWTRDKKNEMCTKNQNYEYNGKRIEPSIERFLKTEY